MINNLKLKIEDKCGFEIKQLSNCESLSMLIFMETGNDISYNTLRRLFGLVKKTNPSKSTLNILSQYLGYKNYETFCSKYPKKMNWDLNQKVYSHVASNPIDALKFMELHYSKNVDLELIIAFFGGLIILDNMIVLKAAFCSEILNPEKYNYSQILYFGNCVGPMLKKTQLKIIELKQTKYFTSMVYNSFIDISSLNGNYGVFTKAVNSTTKNLEQKLFTDCILFLKNFLNEKKLIEVKNNLPITEIHPILYGRYVGLNVFDGLTEKNRKSISSFIDYIQNSDQKIDYLYEFIFACLLSGDAKLLSYLEKVKNIVKSSGAFYQEYHYNIIYLVRAILKLSRGEKIEKEIKELKTNTFFRNSHQDFIDIFISVMDYHSSKEKKLNTYNMLSQKIGYPFFNESYCKNYFGLNT